MVVRSSALDKARPAFSILLNYMDNSRVDNCSSREPVVRELGCSHRGGSLGEALSGMDEIVKSIEPRLDLQSLY